MLGAGWAMRQLASPEVQEKKDCVFKQRAAAAD